MIDLTEVLFELWDHAVVLEKTTGNRHNTVLKAEQKIRHLLNSEEHWYTGLNYANNASSVYVCNCGYKGHTKEVVDSHITWQLAKLVRHG